MSIELTLDEILKVLPESDLDGGKHIGTLSGVAALDKAQSGDIAFLGNPKYKDQVASTAASLVLLPNDFVGVPQDGQCYLRVEEPSYALGLICRIIEERLFPSPSLGIHSSSCIENGAIVADSVTIGPFCHIESGAEIGGNVRIASHVHVGAFAKVGTDSRLFNGVKLLSRCELGERVTLNAGVVVGSEGYGFDQVSGRHEKIPHLGKVVIEDDVEIGANTCIDRSRFAETRIGEGTKIDNLVQIGHNVTIGKRCLVVAQVGISGSVSFEDDVIVGGQAGFAGHLNVGKGAKIAAQAGITKNVEAGAFLKGNPALPYALAQRIAVLQRKLPDLFKRFADLDETT
ncbi:UDP-3-O-(3-hydroxymyristoyl)glucosamine N-acyltransferase [Opitutales bacterium]|jgi:UDP-3-O-[3-hydroxymyristoyl] glucosamine N-acyltransferase|nr:UDP-3-O-(3-hydroxymyristoyl)glucosamine N-acyltransferase [Opitutales bacterium]